MYSVLNAEPRTTGLNSFNAILKPVATILWDSWTSIMKNSWWNLQCMLYPIPVKQPWTCRRGNRLTSCWSTLDVRAKYAANYETPTAHKLRQTLQDEICRWCCLSDRVERLACVRHLGVVDYNIQDLQYGRVVSLLDVIAVGLVQLDPRHKPLRLWKRYTSDSALKRGGLGWLHIEVRQRLAEGRHLKLDGHVGGAWGGPGFVCDPDRVLAHVVNGAVLNRQGDDQLFDVINTKNRQTGDGMDSLQKLWKELWS